MLENVVHKLNVVLLAITILSGCLSCVRIDVPQLFFTGGQEYSTKKLCRVFYYRDKGEWWIEGVDYQNRFVSSKTLCAENEELQFIILPVGTLLKESRSKIEYGFSLWYLFSRYESHRLIILDGEKKGLVVISDNFWNPKENVYDADILDRRQRDVRGQGAPAGAGEWGGRPDGQGREGGAEADGRPSGRRGP